LTDADRYMIWFDREISIFPIIRYWFYSLLLYVFFIINNTRVHPTHGICYISYLFVSSQHGIKTVAASSMTSFVTNIFDRHRKYWNIESDNTATKPFSVIAGQSTSVLQVLKDLLRRVFHITNGFWRNISVQKLSLWSLDLHILFIDLVNVVVFC